MHKGARILGVHCQPVNNGEIVFYAVADRRHPVVLRRLQGFSSNDALPCSDPGRYIGTVHVLHGGYAIHFFDGGEIKGAG